MKKIFLLPTFMTLGIVGCSVDPAKPIDFPPVNAMYAVYDGPQLWVSKVDFVTVQAVEADVQKYEALKNGEAITVEQRIRFTPAPAYALTDSVNQILREYLAETGRFVMESSLSNIQIKDKSLIKNNLALPVTIDAALMSLESKEHGSTHVAKVFGEQESVTKNAVINLIVKDRTGRVLYIAEGKSMVSSSDARVPKVEYLDDYVVNNALQNAVNELARAIDQGHIGSNKS